MSAAGVNATDTIDTILVGAGEECYLDELGRLAHTMGLSVVGRLEQIRRDNSGYLGKGKRIELAGAVQDLQAELVVCDDELTASQSRVLEQSCKASVIDRTELIIRIFEAHARDASSRLEVELADLEYRLPRVKGRNPALSRLGGGTGGGRVTRGPGEQQLEYDRRAIRRRIEAINKKLAEERKARKVRGARLRRQGPPVVVLLGYTNAGKTTILNSLSGSKRSTADRLFETLETTTRLVSSPSKDQNGAGSSYPSFVVTDTVGFIRKLPTQLVHSFASTLESAAEADIEVLCADASSDTLSEEISTANEILSETEKPEDRIRILCLNKTDLLSEADIAQLKLSYPEAVFTSAVNGTDDLHRKIHEAISSQRERVEVFIPHEHYSQVSLLYGRAEVHRSESTHKGVLLDVTLPKSFEKQYEPYRVHKHPSFR